MSTWPAEVPLGRSGHCSLNLVQSITGISLVTVGKVKPKLPPIHQIACKSWTSRVPSWTSGEFLLLRLRWGIAWNLIRPYRMKVQLLPAFLMTLTGINLPHRSRACGWMVPRATRWTPSRTTAESAWTIEPTPCSKWWWVSLQPSTPHDDAERQAWDGEGEKNLHTGDAELRKRVANS